MDGRERAAAFVFVFVIEPHTPLGCLQKHKSDRDKDDLDYDPDLCPKCQEVRKTAVGMHKYIAW